VQYHGGVGLISQRALVLDSQPYRDRHLLVSLLTSDTGMMRGVARGARGGKTPQAAAAQLMSLVHVSGFIGRHAELATFHRIDLVTSSYSLARDLDRAAAAAVVAEVLITFCPPGEPAPRRFRLGNSLLQALLQGVDPSACVAYAQFWTLALGGFLPDLADTPLGPADREVLTGYRRRAAPEISGPVPGPVTDWLDQRIREEAERPLKALDFFRRHGADRSDPSHGARKV